MMETLRRQLALAPHPRMKKVPTSWSPTLSTRWSSSSTSPSPSSTCSTHSAGGRPTPSLWLRGRRTCPWSPRRSLPLEKNPRVEPRKKKLFDQILFLSFGQIHNLDYVEPYSNLIACKVTYSNSQSSFLRIDWLSPEKLSPPCKVINWKQSCKIFLIIISHPHIFAPYPKLMSFIQMLKIWLSHSYCEIHRNVSY